MTTILLHVDLHQKFRAFGIDFGKVDFVHDVPLPVPPELLPGPMHLLSFSQRGLNLNLDLVLSAPALALAAPSPVVRILPTTDIYGNPIGTAYTFGPDGQPVKVAPAITPDPVPTPAGG